MHARSPARRRRALVVSLVFTLTAGLVLASGPEAAPAQTEAKVDPRVLRAVQGGGTVTYWAILRKQAELSGASSITDWDARGAWVVDRLKEVAGSTQAGLKALLSERGASYHSFWVINAVRITSGADTLSAVATRAEVDRVEPTWTAPIPKPLPGETEAIEWNIAHINADDVWNTYNDRGEGITVANIDTGVQYNHAALRLQYRGLESIGGPTIRPNHNYAWYDPSRVCSPDGKQVCDNNGHGTHTMGTIAGDDRGSNQIGVAPRATWIAAKGCETNSCSDFALMKSGEWMLAPTDLNDMNPRPILRPHVVNNSWGTPEGADEFYRATVNAWVASGIFPVFSNGGGGPGCGTVDAPAGYPESYGVGAHNMNNVIASFSGRGPSPISPFPIKPDVTAPGVNVRSSVPPNGYAIFSGTSMAAPHVAGTVALMWSARGAPAFSRDIAGTRAVLDSTAVDMSDLTCGGTPDDNNVWGEGRLDAFGAVTAARNRQLWVARYDSGFSFDLANALGVSPDGSTLFVTGESGGPELRDYATVAYDASTGAEQWVARYNGPGNSHDSATALGVSPDGSMVFVTGQSVGVGTGPSDYATVAYDASTGMQRWVARYNRPRDDNAQALGVSPDGSTVFVTGRSVGTLGFDYATVAYDASTGVQRWVARYDGPPNSDDNAQALGVSPDGSTVFVTGGSSSGGLNYDYATVAYDASTGSKRWVARYSGPGNGDEDEFDIANALGVSPDGSRVFVTGQSQGAGTGPSDYATVAYDASTGAERWVSRYQGGATDDNARALEVGPDGSTVFVTGGSAWLDAGFDYATVAYDASTGAQRWVARYNGSGNDFDYAFALGVSSDGSRVFVTGQSQGAGTGPGDYATVAYDASTGSERWVARYDGPPNLDDNAQALGVSPDGSKLFVTGHSVGLEAGFDYATVAYRS